MDFALGKVLPIRSDGCPSIVFFRSTFCAKCFLSKDLLIKNLRNNERACLIEVDIANNLEISKTAGIRRVPTIVILDQNNMIVGGTAGILTKEKIKPLLHLFRALLMEQSFND